MIWRFGRVLGLAFVTVCSAAPADLGLPRVPQPGDAIPPGPFIPGTSYFGANEFIEYIAGNLPVIFSAPHGGTLAAPEIPTRASGTACGAAVTTVRDANTAELVRQIQSAFFAHTGRYPHIIINHLSRSRLDANRELREAACGNAMAERAWRDYHDFIAVAKTSVEEEHGRGFYTDLHGHGHAIARLELGYELGAEMLRNPDAVLDASFEDNSSIRTFSENSPLAFSTVLRGPTSLGTLLGEAGYPSVPSQQDPSPDADEDYFSGGYNTDRHACSRGGSICGVQLEANNAGVRGTAEDRARFAAAVAAVYPVYLAQFGITIPVLP